MWPGVAEAQPDNARVELGVQVTSARSGEFDASDFGVGGRVAWRLANLIGVEAEIDWYPSDFPDPPVFSRGRTEGLFGATVGMDLGRVTPFAKVRPGFVRFGEAPEPFPCILIFPPPIACAMASGRTVFALDVGGGVEVLATQKTFVRIDAGDRLLKYPGPVFSNSGMVQTNGFWSHDFRFAAGGGLRF